MGRVFHLLFGPFRLDTEKKRIWRDEQQLPLRATAVEVLQMLVEHAPNILSKRQILEHIWAGDYVSDVVLRVCIREIRQVLDDELKSPRYIETMGRKGYRYIGPRVEEKVSSIQGEPGEGFEHIVGRTDELEQLNEWFGIARRGTRQIVFVTGEPGIGKTTLVEMFLAHVRTDRNVRIGRGQCLEQYKEGEPYLPILEALGRLCRDPGGAPIAALLSRYAPTWMIQMPSLLSGAEIASLQQRIQGANQQRMLREMADALEALVYETPFILVLEDLHWSDYSTIDLLAYLGQRLERTRLMVIGTYRPADLIAGHPLKKLKRELQVRRRCEELALAPLNKGEVAAYVGKHIPQNLLSTELTDLIHRRTEGNALFMVNMVSTLQGQMVERDGHLALPVNIDDLRVPESLRQVIEERIDRLSTDDRQILEAASAEGREFSSMVIAAATGKDPLEVEERCAELIRQSQFIHETGTREWPDGIATTGYEFIHALYHEVTYGRLTPGKRVLLHQRVGERLTQAYVNHTGEIAAELARHFEHGRDFYRAVQYLQQAADHATQRFAYPECIRHVTKALGLLQTFPDTVERKQLELKCQIGLGVALMTTKGYADPEAKQAYDRARELCQQIGQTPQLLPVLWGLAAFYYVRAELTTARELGEQLLRVAQEEGDQALFLEAHQELGGTLLSLGEFTSALQYLERGIHLYDPQKYHDHAMQYGQDPGVSCLSHASHALWFLGYPDQALARSKEALVLAEKRGHPYSRAYALSFAAILHQLRREAPATQARAEEAIALSKEQGFPTWMLTSMIQRGWALAYQGQTVEGISQIHEGITSWHSMGAQIGRPQFLALLAEAYGLAEKVKEGLAALTEALSLAKKNDDRWGEVELYRIKGDLLLLLQGKSLKMKNKKQAFSLASPQMEAEAEACFLQALALARRERARSLELRVAVSLGRLWQKQGKEEGAHQMLMEIYNWFQEGLETPDLQTAQSLLADILKVTTLEKLPFRK
jgi:predicted ATPase/DNA-binding winged helix-turn-helix (wHTH) protein